MMRFVFILLFVIAIITGCKDQEEREVRSPPTPKPQEEIDQLENSEHYTLQHAKPTEIIVKGQEFQIIPFFDPILNYIQFIEENPFESKTEAYASTVVEPFRKEAFGESGGDVMKPPKNIDKLKESIQMLDSKYEDLVGLIEESLEKSVDLLEVDSSTKVYLFPFNPDQLSLIKDMNGVTGSAIKELIVLEIAPEQYTHEALTYTMAHEYHHVGYFHLNKDEQKDLINEALIEGKADSFASMIYPDYENPWTGEISENEEKNIMKWINEKRYTYEREDVLQFSSGNDVIPRWSDYKIGFVIMQEFIQKHPVVSVEEWTKMAPDEILERSGYSNK